MKKTKHKLYSTWRNMLRRCYSKKDPGYKYYGGKGILVCKRWHVFANFVDDMGIPPDGLTLDRICGSRGYFKSNCRWADWGMQMNNISKNRRIKLGDLNLTYAQWGKRTGFNPDLIKDRVKLGWKPVDILTIKPNLGNKLKTRNSVREVIE